jgi:SAM-dependent methyltransferase
MDCPVCGDEPAEPQAVVADFETPLWRDTLLALRCVGCGCGYLSPGLVPPDRNRILPQDHARGDAPVAEMTQAGHQYDCVLLNENLEYMSDPRTQLADIGRALRPGGRAVVVLNNPASPSFALFGSRHWAVM